MADIIMTVDTALSEVPVNIAPLIDDTDFKTRETAVAFNAAGMDLVWNFVTTGGAYTQTAVTPTSAGTYDWAHQGDGMYSIEIPASGGASINNDTEGFGWFTGFATGVLPWRGPIIAFVPANSANSIVNGTDNLAVDCVQWNGANVATPTQSGVPEVDVTHFNGTAGTFASGRPEVNASHIEGKALSAKAGDNFDVFFHNAAGDTTVVVDDVGTGGGGLDAAGVRAAVGLASANLDTQLSGLDGKLDTIDNFLDTEIAAILAAVDTEITTIDDFLDTEIAAIKAKTDQLTFTTANKVDSTIQAAVDLAQGAADKVWSTAARTLTSAANFQIKKNTALSGFMFKMIDSSDHISPKTGLTITAQRSLDGAAFGACANAAAEVSNGWYKIDLAAGDLNGNTVALKFTSAGADQRDILIITQA